MKHTGVRKRFGFNQGQHVVDKGREEGGTEEEVSEPRILDRSGTNGSVEEDYCNQQLCLVLFRWSNKANH